MNEFDLLDKRLEQHLNFVLLYHTENSFSKNSVEGDAKYIVHLVENKGRTIESAIESRVGNLKEANLFIQDYIEKLRVANDLDRLKAVRDSLFALVVGRNMRGLYNQEYLDTNDYRNRLIDEHATEYELNRSIKRSLSFGSIKKAYDELSDTLQNLRENLIVVPEFEKEKKKKFDSIIASDSFKKALTPLYDFEHEDKNGFTKPVSIIDNERDYQLDKNSKGFLVAWIDYYAGKGVINIKQTNKEKMEFLNYCFNKLDIKPRTMSSPPSRAYDSMNNYLKTTSKD